MSSPTRGTWIEIQLLPQKRRTPESSPTREYGFDPDYRHPQKALKPFKKGLRAFCLFAGYIVAYPDTPL